MLDEISILATTVDGIVNCDDVDVRNSLYDIFMLSRAKVISVRFITSKDNVRDIFDSYTAARRNIRHGVVDFIVVPTSCVYGCNRNELLDNEYQINIQNMITMINLTEPTKRMTSKFLTI